MVVILLVAAYLPALAWLWFFYSRDRYQREPKRMVLNLFLLGLGANVAALAVIGAADGILSQLLGPVATAAPVGLEPGSASDRPADPPGLGGSVLGYVVVAAIVAAAVQEFAKYGFAASRVYGDPNFDEPVDGMVYMASVGLGFAAALNAAVVVNFFNGELSFVGDDAGTFTSALILATALGIMTTLAHASFSGIVGYFMKNSTDRSQGSRPRVPWIGLVCAIALNASLTVALPAGGLIGHIDMVQLSAGVAVLLVAVAAFAYLFRQALRRSPHRVAELGRASTLVGVHRPRSGQ